MCTKDMIIKELQFKILHRYLPTNSLLFKMKKIESQKCTFCNIYNESILHIFYDCFEVKNLWLTIMTRLEKIDGNVRKLTRKDIILGYSLEHISPSNLLINNVVLQVKSYLWKCKILCLQPSYIKLKQHIENQKMLDIRLELFCNEI